MNGFKEFRMNQTVLKVTKMNNSSFDKKKYFVFIQFQREMDEFRACKTNSEWNRRIRRKSKGLKTDFSKDPKLKDSERNKMAVFGRNWHKYEIMNKTVRFWMKLKKFRINQTVLKVSIMNKWPFAKKVLRFHSISEINGDKFKAQIWNEIEDLETINPKD